MQYLTSPAQSVSCAAATAHAAVAQGDHAQAHVGGGAADPLVQPAQGLPHAHRRLGVLPRRCAALLAQCAKLCRRCQACHTRIAGWDSWDKATALLLLPVDRACPEGAGASFRSGLLWFSGCSGLQGAVASFRFILMFRLCFVSAGRWGNARSPAYGTLSDYQFMRRHSGSEKRREKARAAWGANLNSVADVVNVFVKYTSGAPLPGHLPVMFMLVCGKSEGSFHRCMVSGARPLKCML